jgi:hypothetical protein
MAGLIEHVKESFHKAEAYISKLDNYILSMDGMSGKKTRHLYNNIASMPDSKYLEIGTWKGSTVCSALCNNSIYCVAIDNWTEFGGPKDEFMNNFNRYRGDSNATFIEADCWSLGTKDFDISKKFNIYMYDGNHDENAHFRALSHFQPLLEDEFIYIVDDWNWDYVNRGTLEAINRNHFDILYKHELFTNNKVHPEWGVPGGAGKDGDWHNGICVFVLKI